MSYEEENVTESVYTYDTTNYFTAPQTPDTPINNLTKEILNLHIKDEGDKMLADEEEPFAIEIELPKTDLEFIELNQRKRNLEYYSS